MVLPWDIEVDQAFPSDWMLNKALRLAELVANKAGHLGLYK